METTLVDVADGLVVGLETGFGQLLAEGAVFVFDAVERGAR